MRAAGRVGDQAKVELDMHGCSSCPHTAQGSATSGSPTVFINDRSALRVGDTGKHVSCCGANSWTAVVGAPAVYINGKAAHRFGDATKHCGGGGQLITGSGNVFFGDVVQRGQIGSSSWSGRAKGSVKLSTLAAQGATISPIDPASFSISLPLKGWFGKVVLGLAALAGAIAIAAAISPAVRKFLQGMATWASYFFRSLLHYVMTQGWNAVGKHDCPKADAPPATVTQQDWASDPEAFAAARVKSDVTAYTNKLLEMFRPVIYQAADDAYPIGMDVLLQHSVVRSGKTHESKLIAPSMSAFHSLLYTSKPAYGEAPDGSSPKAGEKPNPEKDGTSPAADDYLDIDNEFARLRSNSSGAVVYGRAIKKSLTQIRLHYAMIRAGSYLPFEDDPYGYFEHEGDGESMNVIVTRENASSSTWSLHASFFAAHGEPTACCGECTAFAPDGRPRAYVGIGGHALAPSSDRRKGKFPSLDVFDDSHELVYELRTPGLLGAGKMEHEVVFTTRCKWGTDAATEADGPQLGTHSYPGYEEVPMAIGTSIADKDDQNYAPEGTCCEKT